MAHMAYQGETRPDIIVVGAGILGLSTAFSLQHKGYSVFVLDRKNPADEASLGNASAFAFSEILPLATSQTIRKAAGWLRDPLGHLSIPPRYAMQITPWMMRLWMAGRPSRLNRSIDAQTSLMNHSKHALLPFLKKTGTGSMLRRDGNLHVYESRAEFESALPHWDVRERCDIPFEHIHGEFAISEYQPGLDPRFTDATFIPEWYSIDDPVEYAQTIAELFCSRGGRIACAEAVSISDGESEASVQCTNGQSYSAQKIVVCAGAWSHQLARTLGDRIPLETERGYNTRLPDNQLDIRTQITFPGHGFSVTKLNTGIQVGGAVELAGLKLPPNYQHANTLLSKAKSFLPEIETHGGTQWMGFRPSLPDRLPVIGTSKRSQNIVYAFGHGHLGLTQSAGTADLVCSLVDEREPAIDLHPFRPDRF